MGTVIVGSSAKNFVSTKVQHGQETIILKGGAEGQGKVNFKSSASQALPHAALGIPGKKEFLISSSQREQILLSEDF
jgi:GTPase involved in cell partitioning and DNA repair